MTHAAVECAAIIRRGVSLHSLPIVAMCGSGNNGGDGYAIVRTLHSWGVPAVAVEVAPTRPRSDARVMRDAAAALALVHAWNSVDSLDFGKHPPIIIDALFGTGLTRPPAGDELAAIHWMNARASAGSRVIAIDLPSGMDCDTGSSLGTPDSVVRAAQTLTMVCEKAGFAASGAHELLGEILVIPIGGPPVTQMPQTVE